MFYLGNLFIMFALKTASGPMYRLLTNGPNVSNIFALMYALFLLTFGAKFVFRGFQKDHRRSFFGQYFGTVLLIVALINCLAAISHLSIYSILQVAAYLVPGLLISFYNKEDEDEDDSLSSLKGYYIYEEIPAVNEIIEEEPEELSETDLILRNLDKAQKTSTAIQNPIFLDNLIKSENFLKGIIDNGYEMNTFVLKQIEELLVIYLDLQGQTIQTEKTQTLLYKVMDSFGMISKSLETMYDNSFSDKAFSIESDIKTLELKLKAEGLLGSDFDMK